MRAKDHIDYKKESQHLDDTLQWINKRSNKLNTESEVLNKEIIALRKEVSSAVDERLILKLQMQQMVEEDRDKLGKIQTTPYFGRIDFVEKFEEEVETIYIGKFGLYDQEKVSMLVLDWRAPMANIYYSGMDEDVSYRTPKGMVEGKMHLKRRYVLEDSKLEEIHDEKSLQDKLKESIQGDSDFLIESLNKSTSGRLTEIVATIQDQQNKIIRSEANSPLIVQGVAGSGKTTIALHRMAYIIYNRQSERETKYMVVAPNKLFLNYIEEILPDLGVDNVFQTTFEDWALTKLDKKIKLLQGNDKLDTLLTEDEEQTRLIALSAKLRGSIIFKRIIDLKLAHIERQMLPKEPVSYEECILFTYKEIQQMFLVSNKHLPMQGRVLQLGEYLKKRLKDKIPLIKEGIEWEYQKKIKALKQGTENIESIRPQIIELYDERDEKIKTIRKWIPIYVKEYLKRLEMPKTLDFYDGIFEDEETLTRLLAKQIPAEDLVQMSKILRKNYAEKHIETEDLGPLVYIQMKLYGTKEEQKFAHIVVDEAQDLDEMKVAVLREVSGNDAFTFVGDLSQGIYDYKGITNWERMMQRVFEDKKYHYYEMTTSYRSTIEVIELANEVIRKCTEFVPLQAVPVLRHGKKPLLIQCKDYEHRLACLTEDIKGYQALGMSSICILTESKAEGCAVHAELCRLGQDVQWIGEEEEHYEGKVVVMPSYLSKGLEFDAVLIYDVGVKTKEIKPVDIKLMYVMITRALHYLNMYTIGEPMSLLQESPSIEYQTRE